MFELWLVKDSYKINILPVVTSLSWSGSVDSLGVQLDFTMNQDMYMQLNTNYTLDVGDTLTLLYIKDKKVNVVWQGILVTQKKERDFVRSYTCFDYAFYLNKSQEVIQYKNVTTKQAIEKLLDKYKIKHSVCSIPTNVKMIYSDKAVSEIIQDLLDKATAKTGKKYHMFMKKGTTLTIEEYKKRTYDSSKLVIRDLSVERSIENLANKVVVHNSSEKSMRVYTQVKDEKSIAKFGLIQVTQSIDDKAKSTANSVAKSKLKELNRVTDKASLTCAGDSSCECGMLIHVYDESFKIDKTYVIKSISHSVQNNDYTMTLDLEVWNG